MIFAAVAAFGLFAQDEAAFQTEMKSMDKHAAVIRKLPAKTGDDVASNAEEIVKLYGSMHQFWAKRNVEDALKWTQEGKTAAEELVSAAKAGDTAKAEAAFKAVGGTCRSCHTAHREKLPDGTYKIK
jgi:cytochrome c556